MRTVHKFRLQNRGFTIIELLLVIALLGIVAVFALPNIYDWTDNAHQSAVNGVAASVRSGVALYKANQALTTGAATLPADLETETFAQALCTADATNGGCFDVVLDASARISDAHWCWHTASSYRYYTAVQTACGGTDHYATVTYSSTSGAVAVAFE